MNKILRNLRRGVAAAGRRWWLAAPLAWLLAGAAQAQPEFSAWCFGYQAGLQFPVPAGGPPTNVNVSRMLAIEGCASVADSVGNLLLYTNGEQAYGRQGLLTGGQLSGSVGSLGSNAVQGTLLLRYPGRFRRYLLFKIGEAQFQFAGGLRYTEIQLRPDEQTGEVLTPQLQRLTPVDYRVTEAMTAVRHANGTDYWIVVHGYLNSEFLSYHLSVAGLDTVPVRSVTGSFHGFANPGTAMRASPDGRQLAVGLPANGAGVELFDFDSQTGRLANPRLVPGVVRGYGLEFSPDGNLLYVGGGNTLTQVNLRGTSPPVQLGLTPNDIGTVQRGPDDRLYVALYQGRALGVVTAPNVVGSGCGFQPAGLPLTSQSLYGLPNNPNQPSRPTRIVAEATVCAGSPLTLRADGPLAAGVPAAWDFGDPAAGPANLAIGSPASHRYARPGRYTVTLTLTGTAVGTIARTWLVQVLAAPFLRLSARPDTLLCEGTAGRLRASPQSPGTQFRWSDGSTDSTLLVQQPGRYVLEVRNAAGCLARDSVQVTVAPCHHALPNLILAGGRPANQQLVLQGLVAADWSIAIFNRWGREVYRQEAYDNSWAAAGKAPGLYYYLLRNRATGYRLKGWVEVLP